MAEHKVIVVVGPTASGKSALAVKIARRICGEVLSADSRQVYRGLDIGTGKITKREMSNVRHHLLDAASPKGTFTAHDFALRARAAIDDILSRGRVPIVCGGSGFYIDAALGRIALANAPADSALRARLDNKSTEALFRALQKKDPQRARTIDRDNKRRLIRALEIAHATAHSVDPLGLNLVGYEVLWIGLRLPSDTLRTRINKRLRDRLRMGMIAEGTRLHARGLSYKRMRELGLEYRSLARFLRYEITREQMETELQSAIWHYARRQMTYWRRNGDIHWFDPAQTKLIMREVDQFVV